MEEIVSTYYAVKQVGFKKVKIGNSGIIAETEQEIKELIKKSGNRRVLSLNLDIFSDTIIE